MSDAARDIERFMKTVLLIFVVSIPLAFWKLIEIVIWLFGKVS